MNKIYIWFTAFAALAVSFLIGGQSLLSDETKIELRPHDAEFVALGKTVYDANCASCHGKNLEGQPNWRSVGPDGKMPAPPHNRKGHTWHHADKLLFELTKFGLQKFAGENYESNMPAYKDVLSDREILASLSYIKSRWPAEIRERHDEMNRAANAQKN